MVEAHAFRARRTGDANMGATLHRRLGPWGSILPGLLMLVGLYVYPLVGVLWISVTEPHVGLGNYARLFSDPAVDHVLWTTLRIGVITTAVSLVLGYLVAYSMVQGSRRPRQWMLICVLLPFWISVLARAFAWVTLLRTGGLINTTLLSLGLIRAPLELLYNEVGVVVGMVHYMLPLAVLTLYANMRGIDRRLVIAARGLGATRWGAFRRVFLPLSLPGIVAAGTLVFIFSLGFFITPAILGGGKTLMVAEFISVMLTETLDWGLGTMLASLLMLAVLLLLALLSRVVDLRRLFGAA